MASEATRSCVYTKADKKREKKRESEHIKMTSIRGEDKIKSSSNLNFSQIKSKSINKNKKRPMA